MCNLLHESYEEIPKEGEAYKLFHLIDGELRPVVFCSDYYVKSRDGWTTWKECKDDPESKLGGGFCGFETEEEAKKALSQLTSIDSEISQGKDVIRKIEYRRGLGKQKECGFVGVPVEMILFKAFRVVEETE